MTIRLPGVNTVTGRVTNRLRKPIAGVSVQLFEVVKQAASRLVVGVGGSVVSDSEGRFVLRDVPEGSYYIRVDPYARPMVPRGAESDPIPQGDYSAGFYPDAQLFAQAVKVMVRAGTEPVPVDVTLGSSTRFPAHFRLNPPQGTEITSAEISVRRLEVAPDEPFAYRTRRVAAAAAIVLDGLEPGQYVAVARARSKGGGSFGALGRFSVGRQGSEHEVTLDMVRGEEIRGQVQTERQSELVAVLGGSAMVMFRPMESTSFFGAPPRARISETGLFTQADLLPGEYQVFPVGTEAIMRELRCRGSSPIINALIEHPGCRELAMAIERGAGLQVKAARKGQPLPGHVLVLHREPGSALGGERLWVSAQELDQNGSVDLKLAAGRYTAFLIESIDRNDVDDIARCRALAMAERRFELRRGETLPLLLEP